MNEILSPETTRTVEDSDNIEAKESKVLKMFRNKVMRALLLSGTLAAVEACGGVKKEDMENLPLTSIEDLTQRPDEYADEKFLRVEGYIESGDLKFSGFVYNNRFENGDVDVLTGPIRLGDESVLMFRKSPSWPKNVDDIHKIDALADPEFVKKLDIRGQKFEVVGFVKYTHDESKDIRPVFVITAAEDADSAIQ